MPVKYIPYYPDTVEGQAILNNFTRTRRALKYRDNDKVYEKIKRGMPYYEVEKTESVGNNHNNMLIRGECISACAYLKENGIKVDLVYIDPPFASGADYAKKVYIRRNPKVAEVIKKAEEKIDIDELQAFEEKMYGDIWNKEAYLNWMYENLMAIKIVMSETASIYVHLDWHIGHYVKVLMDEVFGENSFEREIIWDNAALSGFKTKAPNWIKAHDTILYYTLNEDKIFNKQSQPHRKEYLARFDKEDKDCRKYFDGRGDRIYLDDVIKKGKSVGDVWYDIMSFQQIPTSSENVDYSTQKPEALLDRIIKASSNEFRNEKTKERMLVADFFGGSGVAAKVSNDLGRNFIHVDVGLNSIQTTRDRLIEAKAEFDIIEIKDGVNLFRNPVQTMDKLVKLIPGLQKNNRKNGNGISKFWFGYISDSKLGTVPVYVPDLTDHTQKVLDIPIANQLVNLELPELVNVKKAVVYYIDIDEPKEIEKFIHDNNMTEIKIELRDLKQLLDDTVANDIAEYKTSDKDGVYTIEFTKFISDRLRQKIDEYNQKGMLQPLTGAEENEGKKLGIAKSRTNRSGKKFTPIEISKEGLELIELISLDCENKDGNVWHSDREIKIDKLGYVIEVGKKTKNFWDAKITCNKNPLRLKVRNIAGDEVIIGLHSDQENPKIKKSNDIINV